MTRTPAPPTRWGDWQYDADRFALTYVPSRYDIDLDTCTDSAQVLDWIFQVTGKGWGDKSGSDVIEAFRAILRPQAYLCSDGRGKTIQPRKVAAANGYRVP